MKKPRKISDEYIAALIAEDASNLNSKYEKVGISAFNKKSKVNKNFVKNIIKNTTVSNAFKKKVEK